MGFEQHLPPPLESSSLGYWAGLQRQDSRMGHGMH